jgi:tetratricopeptide (TPR) repeat protein
LLADSIATARILLLVNYRPEYHHEWGSKTYYTQLRLDPLVTEKAKEMLQFLLGDSAELEPLKRFIIEKSEGNPFFMEEMVQVMLADGVLVRNGKVKLTASLNQLKIPFTVQAILASRIDRLPPDQKDLLQTLAVMGREFPFGLVQKVVAQSEDELAVTLHDLQLAEFIYERPSAGDFEYIFKHALTQEVAYNSVLIAKRTAMHEKIGAAIEALATSRTDDHIGELAHHYSLSDNPMKAAHYLNLASVQAQQRSAFPEATELARRGLSVLANGADGRERDSQEIGLQITLAQSLAPSFSPGFVEVEGAYTRALELCKRTQDGPQMIAALVGLQLHFRVSADGRRAQEISEQLLTIAMQTSHPVLLVIAHALEASSLSCIGRPDGAREHGERSLAALGPEDRMGLNFHFTAALPALSCSLWLLGFPDRARNLTDEAISKARRLKDAALVLISLTDGCWEVDRFLRDPIRAREHAEAAITIGSELGFRALELSARGHRAWSMVYERRTDEGLEELRRVLEGRNRFGMGSRPSILAMLAEAHLQMQQPAAGLKALEQAFLRVEPTGERMYEAELYRLKGELLLAQDASNASQAEQSFHNAIEISRKQNAKSWELRATTRRACKAIKLRDTRI